MKQYLLMCDEAGKALLEKVIGGIQMLEVSGLTAGDDKMQYNLLVTPIVPQVQPVTPQPPETLQEKQDEQ
jgi:hypothetical protein